MGSSPLRAPGPAAPGTSHLTPVVEAVAWSLAEARAGPPRSTTFGPAVPSEEEDGLFEVRLGDRPFLEDRHRQLRLRCRETKAEYEVDLVLADNDVLTVRPDRPVTHPDRLDLIAGEDLTFILERLHKLLAALDGPRPGDTPRRLLAGILNGTLTPAPDGTEQHPDLSTAQNNAVSAIAADGVQAVWGPPGTGKTRVIATAVADAVRRGRSVLLVSTANAAIDHALLQSHDRLTPNGPVAPGVLVRVGTPQDERVAASRLTLASAVHARNRPLQDEADALARELRILEADPDLVRQQHLTDRLEEADQLDFATPLQKVQAEQRWRAAQEALAATTQALHDAEAALRLADEELAEARKALEDPAELRWRRIDSLDDEVTHATNRISKAVEEHTAALADHDRAEAALRACGRFSPGRRKAARLLDQARHDLEGAANRIEQATRGLAETKERCQAQAERIRADLPADRDAVWRAQVASRIRDAVTAVEQGTQQRDELRRDRERAERSAVETPRIEATPQDRDLVARYRQLPALRQELSALNKACQSSLAERGRIERRIEEVDEAMKGAQKAVIENASVVATTLASMVVQEAVAGRRFDLVVVDEVSTATLPYLVAAASLADGGVTLIGDFLQLGAVVNPDPTRPGDNRTPPPPPHVASWLTTDPFAHVGLRTRSDADVQAGCVALTAQHRFGPAVQRFVNELIYDGALTLGTTWTSPMTDHGSEMVLVDTTPLPPSTQWITRGRSARWMLGTLLTTRLIDAHPDATIGIVSPFRDQTNLYRSLLADLGVDQRVRAGTVHAFQGQEFDVVIFDLVSSPYHLQEVALATRSGEPRQLSDLKLANVALTRTRGRIYLIGSIDPIAGKADQVPSDGFFALLRQHRDEGALRVSPASDLITDTDDDDRLIRCYGRERFYARLNTVLGGCRCSVEIWSPFSSPSRLDKLNGLPGWRRVIDDSSIRVSIVTKPPDEHEEDTYPALQALRYQGVEFTRAETFHEKLVIVDGETAFWGSVNLLQSGTSTELMTEYRSRQLCDRLRRTAHSQARHRR